MPTIKKPDFAQLDKRVAARRAAIAKLKLSPLSTEQMESYSAERVRMGLPDWDAAEVKESNIDGEYVGDDWRKQESKNYTNTLPRWDSEVRARANGAWGR